VHLVGYFHSCVTMHGFMNVKRSVVYYCPVICLDGIWKSIKN